MTREPFTRLQFVRFLMCWPLYICLCLLVCEALLSAATTWLVIKVGRDVANGNFFVMDLVWILLVQCSSYAAGAISWVFAERRSERSISIVFSVPWSAAVVVPT